MSTWNFILYDVKDKLRSCFLGIYSNSCPTAAQAKRELEELVDTLSEVTTTRLVLEGKWLQHHVGLDSPWHRWVCCLLLPKLLVCSKGREKLVEATERWNNQIWPKKPYGRCVCIGGESSGPGCPVWSLSKTGIGSGQIL